MAEETTRTWTPRPGFNKAPDLNRETKAERDVKQRMINRQSARRDAIDYLTAQGKPFSLDEVARVMELLFDLVNR